MTLKVRHPNIDLSSGFKRHWYGDNLAVTHTFNALSWMFPKGEKFFIDALKSVAKNCDLSQNPKLAQEVKGFVSQELIHSHHHELYNKGLINQGFSNVVEPAIVALSAFTMKHLSSMTNLAFVAAYEHYTAILGDFLLKDPDILLPAQKELALVWGWHAVEETEHKAVCFDLYQFNGGGWLRRVWTFSLVSFSFSILFTWSYFNMLYRDRALRPSRIFKTIKEGSPFYWGRKGLVWHLIFHSVKYLSPKFHPWNHDNSADALRWVETYQKKFK